MPSLAGASVILSIIAIASTIAFGFARLDAQQQAVIAADLAALSAAQAHNSGDPDACAVAGIFSDANRAKLTSCLTDVEGPGTVSVEVRLRGRHARAVAGPVGSVAS